MKIVVELLNFNFTPKNSNKGVNFKNFPQLGVVFVISLWCYEEVL